MVEGCPKNTLLAAERVTVSKELKTFDREAAQGIQNSTLMWPKMSKKVPFWPRYGRWLSKKKYPFGRQAATVVQK